MASKPTIDLRTATMVAKACNGDTADLRKALQLEGVDTSKFPGVIEALIYWVDMPAQANRHKYMIEREAIEERQRKANQLSFRAGQPEMYRKKLEELLAEVER